MSALARLLEEAHPVMVLEDTPNLRLAAEGRTVTANRLYVERGHRHLHIWFGQWGVHIYWPDVWKSRADRCRQWREGP